MSTGFAPRSPQQTGSSNGRSRSRRKAAMARPLLAAAALLTVVSGGLAHADPSASQSTAPGSESPIQAYYDLVYWLSVGRADEAASQFSDTAVVVAGPECTLSSPCVGRAAIRAHFLVWQDAGALTLMSADQRFDGHRLSTRGVVPKQVGSYPESFHLKGGYVFDFQDGRITNLRFGWDEQDTTTALYLKSLPAGPQLLAGSRAAGVPR